MLGGKLGNGKQWFPWIHIDDVAGIVLKSVTDKKMSGAYNCTAPGIVTNGEFTKTMAKAVKRPVLIPFIPAFVLRLVLGEFGSFLTKGQRAVPERLLNKKFQFKFPGLNEALADLLKK
jgi:NAD dependent epimerase/dehydratase family enzyme